MNILKDKFNFYKLAPEEAKRYMEMKLHDPEEFESLLGWFAFRMDHQFLSWVVMKLNDFVADFAKLHI